MLHEDYLLRLLRPFLQAMANILALKNTGDGSATLAEIDRTAHQLLGLNSTLMNKLSEHYLLELLEINTDFGALRCLILAGLLKEEADVYRMQDQEEASQARYIRALNIYLETLFVQGKTDLRNDLERVEEIATLLSGVLLPQTTRYQLFRYFERNQKYGRAEDALFDLIAQYPADSGTLRDGIAFYRRLLTKRPDELIKGNLPHEEVQAGLKELIEMQESQQSHDN